MPCIYSNPVPPVTYMCGVCGASNVKLWREYMAWLGGVVLHCARCAALNNNVDIATIDARGFFISDLGRTDQIGNYVPAVPTEAGTSYWGYTSVPPEAVEWWQHLPTLTFPT